MKAIITVGVSASGKSTWAKAQQRIYGSIISNRDSLRFSLTDTSGWREYRFEDKIERMVTGLQTEILRYNSWRGQHDVIIADTNLHKHRRKQLVDECRKMGYEVIVKAFPIPLELAIERDARRGDSGSVGREVIHRQWQQWLEFLKE